MAVSSLVYAAPTPQKLDGKVFSGEVGEKGDKKGDADNFEFKNGTFRSTACDEFGFTSAPYSLTEKNGKRIFTSTTHNDGGDQITWNGEVKGDAISGTAERKTKSGEKFSMWFNGTLRK